MAYERALWLPRVLRAAGIEVVEHPGWRERGLGSHRPFTVDYIVWHHDASPAGDSPGVPGYMIRNFERAGAQVWVDRRGRWHLVASGRAAHAGSTRNHVKNENSLGIETDHTTNEDWPPALLNSLRVGTAAILNYIGQTSTKGLHFHKSICAPRGRKIDPAGLNLHTERTRVGAERLRQRRKKAPDKRPKVSLRRMRKRARRARWAVKYPASRQLRRVKRALKAEGMESYAEWQRHLGYEGEAANGVPGKASLTALGKAHGFRVVR